MHRAWLALLPLWPLALSACSSEANQSGIGEPLRVTNAQFFEGEFPGGAETTNGTTTKLDVTQLNIKNSEFLAGTTGKVLSGLAGQDSQSVAFALQGRGHGYWVLPVGAPDQVTLNTFQWSATCDFAHDLPDGALAMQIAAADASGHFGPTTIENLHVDALLPKGQVVASLTWGADVDLDLHLVGPSGKELDPKHPNSSKLDSDGMAVAGSGLLDRDSLAACVPDGVRTENVVWKDNPQKGTYLVRVDMFSACSKPAASFVFTLSVGGQEVLRKTGRLLDIDADGGGPGSGLFVTEFTCKGSGTCS